jgi:hypothetical protein
VTGVVTGTDGTGRSTVAAMKERLWKVVRTLSWRFRTRRMQRFCDAFSIDPETLVLDIGGSGEIWDASPTRPRLVILNKAEIAPVSGVWIVRADARHLPFRDTAFPVVFSNSVMEHVGDYRSQQRYAAEVRRVGRSYFVQTGNQRFPVELHYMTPFIHWLPKAWQRRLIRNFTVWGLMVRPSDEEAAALLDELRLPTEREFRACFPDAEMEFERLFGMKKALIAVKHPDG